MRGSAGLAKFRRQNFLRFPAKLPSIEVTKGMSRRHFLANLGADWPGFVIPAGPEKNKSPLPPFKKGGFDKIGNPKSPFSKGGFRGNAVHLSEVKSFLCRGGVSPPNGISGSAQGQGNPAPTVAFK